METIIQFPTWAETVLVICMAIMLAGLALWISCKAIHEAIEAEAKLQRKRRKTETEALNNWKLAYDAEHEEHLQDVAELSAELNKLRRDVERKNALLAKVKVKDL